MMRQAAGELPLLDQAEHQPRGAIDPGAALCRGSGARFPPERRPADACRVARGCARRELDRRAAPEVTPFYDPMLAKLIVHGDRRATRRSTQSAARARPNRRSPASRPTSTICRQLSRCDAFASGEVLTRTLQTLRLSAPRRIEVLAPGTQTTVQDWPGRLGYWDVGVPPSGPMDALSFRLANRIVGNAEGAAGARMHARRPDAALQRDAVDLPGRRRAWRRRSTARPCPIGRRVAVTAGQVLQARPGAGAGVRAYLAVRGGFDVPVYLGSRVDLHARRVRRPCGRALQSRRRAACRRRRRRQRRRDRIACTNCRPRLTHDMGDRRALRPARRAGLLHRRRHRQCSSPPNGRCTTTPTAPACA